MFYAALQIYPEVLWIMVPPIVFLNVLVMVIFVKTPKMRIAENYFVFAMSICHFLTGLFIIPLFLTSDSPSHSLETLESLRIFVLLSLCCSCCYDRFCAIVSEGEYDKEDTSEKKAFILIVKLFLLCLIIGMLPLIWMNRIRRHKCYITLSCAVITLASVIQLLMYTFIFIKVHLLLKRIRIDDEKKNTLLLEAQPMPEDSGRLESILEKFRATKIFCIITIMFLMLWLPSGYLALTEDIINTPEFAPQWIHILAYYTRYLLCVFQPTLIVTCQKNVRDVIKSWKCQIGQRMDTVKDLNSTDNYDKEYEDLEDFTKIRTDSIRTARTSLSDVCSIMDSNV